jgi:hypothetical protein
VATNCTSISRLSCNITCDPAGCADCDEVNLTANATGGPGNYRYVWSTAETTQSINVTSSGNYTVNVTDSYNHTTSCYQTATIYDSPDCNITAPSGVCENSTGNSANTSSGYTSYNWTLSAGSITGGQNTDTITWTAPDSVSSPVTLNVTVTDANNCTASCSRNVTVNALPDCNISCDPAGCVDFDQVTLTANSTGGTEPYTYLWGTNETSQSINVTSSGNYSVTVTDGNNCTGTCSKQVTITPGICSIGDTVFYDYNDDGVQDPGEPGIPGVQVTVYRDDGDGKFNPTGGTDDVVCSLTTGDDGKYVCADILCADIYWVVVDESTLPPGLSLTTSGNP